MIVEAIAYDFLMQWHWTTKIFANLGIFFDAFHLPKKSARTERAPIQRPPKAAAVGMYRFNSWIIDCSLCPLITICWSFSCLATYIKQRWKTVSSFINISGFWKISMTDEHLRITGIKFWEFKYICINFLRIFLVL